MSWERGRETVLDLIDKGELTKVVADLDLAHRMLYQANQHVQSVNTLASDDPYAAYSLIHDAIRKALAAMLQAQGLRATTAGGHLAVQFTFRGGRGVAWPHLPPLRRHKAAMMALT